MILLDQWKRYKHCHSETNQSLKNKAIYYVTGFDELIEVVETVSSSSDINFEEYTIPGESSKNFESLIDEWKSNKHEFAKRKAIIQNSNIKLPAFNEVVVIKNSPSRLLDLSIETYEQKVKLRADGLIISTSLGSTAYNYSAGGPIIHNDIESIVVTPISPFSKFPRSIVLSGKSHLNVTILKNQNYAIQFDGVMEVQEKSKTNVTYKYELSNKLIRIIGQDNNPKIDHFLNQILR